VSREVSSCKYLKSLRFSYAALYQRGGYDTRRCETSRTEVPATCRLVNALT